MKKFDLVLLILFSLSFMIMNGKNVNADQSSYNITSNLYHEDPSYCSKYVYLSYLWGANPKALIKYKLNAHIVTPHGLIGNFINSYILNAFIKL